MHVHTLSRRHKFAGVLICPLGSTFQLWLSMVNVQTLSHPALPQVGKDSGWLTEMTRGWLPEDRPEGEREGCPALVPLAQPSPTMSDHPPGGFTLQLDFEGARRVSQENREPCRLCLGCPPLQWASS